MATGNVEQKLAFETLSYGTQQNDWLALMEFVQRYNDAGNHDYFPVHQYFKSRKALQKLELLDDTELTPAGKGLIADFNKIVCHVMNKK
ncbi:MAG: hypothetical protein U9N81_07280 [Bacillota bacterium]|nr:hypothetical protein [Bacillota bacterium]